MTTIVTALNRCARMCSIDTPSNWTTETEEGAVALRDDFLLEVIEEIQERIDAPAPFSGTVDLTSASTKTGNYFDMPSDFKRLHRGVGAVYDTGQDKPCIPVVSDSEWTNLQEWGATGAERYFRMNGYEGNYGMQFDADLATGDTVTVHYVSTNWMITSGGTEGAAFTAVDDVLLYPRGLVESGVVARFRDRNGLDSASARGEFERELNRFSNDARVRRSVSFGGHDPQAPWDIPVPSYIPEAP